MNQASIRTTYFTPQANPLSSNSEVYIGVEFGQVFQYSALSVIERTGMDYILRQLDRFELRIPYSHIVKRVTEIHGKLAEQEEIKKLVIVADETGTGPEVTKLLKGSSRRVRSITVSAGNEVTRQGWRASVPKRNIIQSVQLPLQDGHLTFAKGLQHVDTFMTELANFKMKAPRLDLSSLDVWRESEQDDLVLAVCLPVWASKNWGFTPHFQIATTW